MKILLEYLNAETWEVCAVQEQRIHLLSYQIIQKVFITISGSVGFYISKPYTDVQPGEDGNDRKVWMFPIRPVPDNDVKKPQLMLSIQK